MVRVPGGIQASWFSQRQFASGREGIGSPIKVYLRVGETWLPHCEHRRHLGRVRAARVHTPVISAFGTYVWRLVR